VATVSPSLAPKPVVGFFVEPQNQGGGGFPGLGLKITATVLGLELKTKQASVCRLCHKTDGGRSAQDTRRDLVACLVWKQV
jgi:hypothetical protein